MKKLIFFSIVLFLASFQAFSAGSAEGISAEDSRNKKEEVVKTIPQILQEKETEIEAETAESTIEFSKDGNYEKAFVVSKINDKDLTLEILSYKEKEDFFPEGIKFQNDFEKNPLIQVSSMRPTYEEYLKGALLRIKNEGGIIRIIKNDEYELAGNVLFIFSQDDYYLMVIIRNFILLEIENEEEVFKKLDEWHSS